MTGKLQRKKIQLNNVNVNIVRREYFHADVGAQLSKVANRKFKTISPLR